MSASGRHTTGHPCACEVAQAIHYSRLQVCAHFSGILFLTNTFTFNVNIQDCKVFKISAFRQQQLLRPLHSPCLQLTIANMSGDNKMRMFEAMDREMHILAHSSNDDNDNKEKSEEIAHTLLAYPELPLGMRCRALLVLGTSDGPGYVEWAREAVRIAELGKKRPISTFAAQAALIDTSLSLLAMSLPGSAPSTEGDRKLLADCRLVLKEAEEDFVKYGGYPDEEGSSLEDGEEDEGDGDGDGGEEDEAGDGEVDAEAGDGGASGDKAKQASEDAGSEEK